MTKKLFSLLAVVLLTLLCVTPVFAQSIPPAQSPSCPPPQAVDLVLWGARAARYEVTLDWITASETLNLGFNIWRATAIDASRIQVNTTMIPTCTYPGSPSGCAYTFVDTSVHRLTTYFYWLEDVDMYGGANLSAAIRVRTK